MVTDSVESDEISILSYINVLLKWRWLIIIGVFISVIVMAVISLQKPNVYTATAKVYIGISDIGNKERVVQGIYKGSDIQTFYLETCKTTTFQKKLITKEYQTSLSAQQKKLEDIFNIKSDNLQDLEDNLLLKLNDIVDISADMRAGILFIEANTFDPVLSADIANSFANELVDFSINFNLSSIRNKKKFLEKRMQKAQERLVEAENNLKTFSQKNRQILNLPELKLKFTQLEREVKLQEELFISLSKEYELAKIEETKNFTPVSIHENARPPKHRSKPKRRQSVMIAGALSFIGTSFLAFFIEYMKKQSDRPEANEFRENLRNIGRDFFFITWFFRKKGKK